MVLSALFVFSCTVFLLPASQGNAPDIFSTKSACKQFRSIDSFYVKMCCNSSNKGQSILVEENGKTRIVFCHKESPQVCSFSHTDCADWYASGYTISGVYIINPDGGDPFEVYCDMDTEGGGWIVFQRREDGSVDFYRNWTTYEEGFGDLNGEFWLGLSKIHRLTNLKYTSKLRVDLEDFENETRYAEYSEFTIGNSSTNYTITVQGYSGNAGNGLLQGGIDQVAQFSTKDRDNDKCQSCSCALQYKGGWWYTLCHWANLNGLYLYGATDRYAEGVTWAFFRGHDYSLKFTEMKLRKPYKC